MSDLDSPGVPDQFEPLGDTLAPEMAQHQFAGVVLVVGAGTTRAPTGSPVTSTATR